MKYIPRFLFGIYPLFLLLLIYFQMHGESYECCSDKNYNDAAAVIENLQLADEVISENVFRLTVATDITLEDTTSKEIGNIMKKNSAGEVRRFIHNFGKDNTFIGIRSGNFSMTDVAINNTAIGVDSLRRNISGKRNTAIGKAAATENRGGDSNVAVGYRALRNNTVGSFNTAVGDSALVDLSSTGAASSNVAIGRNALRGLTEGSDNLAVGALAGYCANAAGYSGSRNSFVGYQAGSSADPGNDNVYIGNQAGSLTSGGADNLYIGHFGLGSSESRTIRIGMSSNQKGCFIAGVYGVQAGSSNDSIPVLIDSNGQLGTQQSSRRFKDNINRIYDESEAIYYLTPVSFAYKADETGIKHYGLIAEDVDQFLSFLVIKDDNGAPYTVRYDLLPVLLLNEIKKHHRSIERQKYAIQEQEDDIQKQKHAIQEQKHIIQKQEYDMQKQENVMSQQKDAVDNLLCIVNDLQKKAYYFVMK